MPLAAIGAEFLINPPPAGVWVGIVFLVLAAGFVPAVWVSLRPIPARPAVLKAETVWCVLLALVASMIFGFEFAVLLTVPTLLLAIAAGLIFQPSPRRSRK